MVRTKRKAEAGPPLPVVQPATRNVFAEVYQPPPPAYYRNNGNKHIPSRGFPC